MQRVKLVVQYDGTDFYGWAEQKQFRTVQCTLKEYIHRISGEEVELRGASRTDSGAHALGQVADFATRYAMPAKKWAEVINKLSGSEIRIVKSVKVPMEFHSRFFARSRTYEYRISELQSVCPLESRFVYASGHRMELENMQIAAKFFEGKHDFRYFGTEMRNVDNAVRELYGISIKRVGSEIRIQVEGTAFLKGMMRRIAGGLFEVGRGKRESMDMKLLLNPQKRGDLAKPQVLPAKGLTLLKVKFGRKLRDLREEDLQQE